MSNKVKRIQIIELLGKKADWESWSKKFLSCGKQNGYKKLFVTSKSMSGVDMIPMQEECKNALEGDINLNKKIAKQVS